MVELLPSVNKRFQEVECSPLGQHKNYGNEKHQQSSSNSTISLPTTILDNTSKFLDNMHSIRVAVALEP